MFWFHNCRIKTKIASKYSMPTQPRLVDIIAAVPHQYKKVSFWRKRKKIRNSQWHMSHCPRKGRRNSIVKCGNVVFQVLLPKLKAKPVRTASGVRNHLPTSFVTITKKKKKKEEGQGRRELVFQWKILALYFITGNLCFLSLIGLCLLQIAVVAVMCKPHRCPHIAMTGNICV